MNAKVSLVHGSHRYTNVSRALDAIAGQIDFTGKTRVLIKPNLVDHRQLSATHNDALRAVLDFVRARYDGPLTLAEGTTLHNTWDSFRHFDYETLAQTYDFTLVDVNVDAVVRVRVVDRRWRPLTLRLSRTVVESDLRISVGPPKTHDTVVVTHSIKNMVMGSLVNSLVAQHSPKRRAFSPMPLLKTLIPPRLRYTALSQRAMARMGERIRSDKFMMHQSYPVINVNLAKLAPWVWPHVAVIDGFEAMEGEGPTSGTPVDWRIALASTDALAADTLATHLMGFDPADVGYLHYCYQLGLGEGDPAQIEVAGNVAPADVRRTFGPHPGYRYQRRWRVAGVEKYLEKAVEVPREL